MRAVILINAYSRLEHSLYQSGRLKEELEKRGVAADIRRNNFFAASLGDGGEVLSRLSGYDFCIYLDKDNLVEDLRGPAMAEDLDYHDGKVITVMESASNKYLFGKLFFYNDIVGLRIE